jgi:hypothetical protein
MVLGDIEELFQQDYYDELFYSCLSLLRLHIHFDYPLPVFPELLPLRLLTKYVITFLNLFVIAEYLCLFQPRLFFGDARFEGVIGGFAPVDSIIHIHFCHPLPSSRNHSFLLFVVVIINC